MKPLYPALLLCLVFATPAWGAEATLEGYGGDGAQLVGIESNGSPFGDRAPAQQGAAPRDGNLVAESGPVTAGGSQGAATSSPTQPSTTAQPPSSTAGEPAQTRRERLRERKRSEERAERPADEPPASVTLVPDPQNAPPIVEGAEPSDTSGASLPFTSRELVLFLAALLGLFAMGAGMRRLALAQPRF